MLMIIIHDMTATVSIEAVEFAVDHPACRNWAGEGYCHLPYVKHHCNNYCTKWEARADATPLLVEDEQARASERRASLLRLQEAHSARLKPHAEGSANVPSDEEEAHSPKEDHFSREAARTRIEAHDDAYVCDDGPEGEALGTSFGDESDEDHRR